jgi:hypothetical protein
VTERDSALLRRPTERWLARPDLAAGAFLFLIYTVTLARGVTFWDAGEFLAAIHSLGIPHPPGTPVFVLAARVWADVLAPLVGFTIAVNAFSAASTATAFAIVANLFWRWTDDALIAFCAATLGGLTSTIWLNATETEVYAATLCLAVIIVWVGDRAGETRDERWLLLGGYLTGLAWALHLTALLGLPGALVLAWPALRAARLRTWLGAIGLLIVGMTPVLFMLVRARHDPTINQGDPATWRALWDALERRQYDVAPLWPRRAPLWLQVANVFEYADWQFALGLAPDPPPTIARTAITIVYAALGLYGALRHRTIDPRSFRAWLVLFLVTSLGVVLYLNLHAGASFGEGVLPKNAVHEARDRDYFFVLAFLCWAAWAGVGAAAVARRIVRRRALAFAFAILGAVLPAALNWRAIRAERHDEQIRADRQARAMLDSVPPNGVFIAVGDNDTYPLWYMQEVEHLRRDVIVVTAPLLPAQWDRAEVLRRHQLIDSADVTHWYGLSQVIRDIRTHAAAQHRAVVVSPDAAQFPLPK